LDPIAGLGKVGDITVWFPTIMLEDDSGHGGSSAGGVKKIK